MSTLQTALTERIVEIVKTKDAITGDDIKIALLESARVEDREALSFWFDSVKADFHMFCATTRAEHNHTYHEAKQARAYYERHAQLYDRLVDHEAEKIEKAKMLAEEAEHRVIAEAAAEEYLKSKTLPHIWQVRELVKAWLKDETHTKGLKEPAITQTKAVKECLARFCIGKLEDMNAKWCDRWTPETKEKMFKL